jgi:uncharacterized protein YbjT (DUF2867 family)
MKTALVAGSTGLIGKQLLNYLLSDSRYEKVIAITRHDLGITHPKLTQLKIEFDQLNEHADQLKADDVFCCLGTTMAKARTKEKFYKVDFTYPLELAKATHRLGAKQYLLVSALGADKNSSIYYNRVKGEIEEAISSVDFLSIHIFRPSLLLGSRPEKRSGEDTAKLVYKVLWFLIPAKYQAIDSAKVAKAMLHFASRDQQGVFTHESKEMQKY